MAEEKLYAFKDLGFQDFIPILVPTVPSGGYRYTTIKIKKEEKAVRDFMLQCLIKFMQSAGKTDFTDEFFGGIAYLKDGGLITIFNGLQGEESKIYNRYFDSEYYKTAVVPEGVVVADNMDYISRMFNARVPKALILLQEIDGDDAESYHFRIVHEKNDDTVPGNMNR